MRHRLGSARVNKALYWFRNDLRLEDNAPLANAFATADELAFVYVHDPRLWHPGAAGLPRFGWHRRRFLHESIACLRDQLSSRGYQLIELWGHPEKILPEVIELEGFHELHFARDAAPFERTLEQELNFFARTKNFSIHSDWSQFLFEPDHLPVDLPQLPQTFTNFRKLIEKNDYANITPRLTSFPTESHPQRKAIFKELGGSTANFQLALHEVNDSLGSDWWIPDDKERKILVSIRKIDAPSDKMNILRGGAQAGMNRIHDYFFGTQAVLRYFETRNGMLNLNDSTLFSAWLSNGSVSPRQILWQLKDFENKYGSNKSTYWVVFELLWREFFKLHMLASGENFFHPEGLYRVPQKTNADPAQQRETLRCVIQCETGQPFVDAHLRELIQTGFMSNRGRQNVASYLMYQLALPWQQVAALFETFLIDYDAASNWGNCAYIAGVSFDPRGGRHFNIEKQQKDYDPLGEYVRAWT